MAYVGYGKATHSFSCYHTTTTTTALWPFFRVHQGEMVPEEGRLTEADTLIIRLGATPSGLTSAHLHHPPASKKYEGTRFMLVQTILPLLSRYLYVQNI